MSDKTEQPTEKKLRDAAEKGDLPRSQAFATGMGMGLWLFILSAAPGVVLGLLRPYMERLLSLRLMQDESATREFFLKTMMAGLIVPCAIALVMAVGLGLIQSQGRLAPKRSWFDLKRINPLSALKQFFGLQRLLGIAMGICRMLVIMSVCFYMGRGLVSSLRDMPSDHYRWMELFMLSLSIGWKTLGICVLICAALGLADLILQIKLWKRRNKMSKQEVKREYRDNDGDPRIKAVRKTMHREMTGG